MAKLNIEDLEARIATRANDAVQVKIQQFKNKIDAALKELFGHTGIGGESFGQYEYFDGSKDRHHEIPKMKLDALKMAVCDYKKPFDRHTQSKVYLPWPSVLWEKERAAIRADLLSKMDLLQQLLLAKPRESDTDVPEQGAKETT